VVFYAVVGICAVLVGDAALRGRWDVVLASLPASGLAVWGAVVLFARPCLRISDFGLGIVNVLSTTDVPWGLVDDVTTRYQVVVALSDGTRIRSWGAPSSARAASDPAGETHTDSSGRITGSPAHRVIRDALDRHSQDDRAGTVRRTWHRATIVTGGVLIAALLVQLGWAFVA
jgi:hypothetical protein